MQPKPVRPHKKIKLEKPGDDKGKLESSKDAYMLVYKRRDGHVSPQFPPAIVMEKVKEENRGLREELNKVGVRKEVLEDEWEHLKGAKVDVIRDLPGACFLPSLYYPLIRLWLTFFFSIDRLHCSSRRPRQMDPVSLLSRSLQAIRLLIHPLCSFASGSPQIF